MDESAVRFWMSDAESRPACQEWVTLLEQAATGNLASFEQLMLRSQHRVLMTARRILGNAADAEEATQEVFLRVYKYLHRFDRSKPFEPWLYRLTVNVCNDIASGRPPVQEVCQENHEAFGVVSDPCGSFEVEEQRQIMQSALSNLPAKQRTAVVLRDLQGLSISEVAAVMNVSQTTVRSHLSTARLRLKQLIEKRFRRPR
jgi:RNA polymerase sigma-70 factor (ECF subfamily)